VASRRTPGRRSSNLDLTVTVEESPGSALGYHEPATGRVVVEASGPRFSANAQVSVLVHEVSHALVHKDCRDETQSSTTPPRGSWSSPWHRSLLAERLQAMGAEGRATAYRAGELDRRELRVWAALWSDEVLLINGDLPWIAATLADLD
jgi:hypothetical protein